MKKTFSFLSLLLCLPLLLCGLFFISNFETVSAQSGETVYLANTTGNGRTSFESFINNYDDTDFVSLYQNANIVLVEDINLQDIKITGTIGTMKNPFKGTFNGRGFSISNFHIQKDELSTKNEYIGIFGYTSGATIKNLQISGNYNVTLNNFNVASTNLGMLVGYAENTVIDKCYINARFNSINLSNNDENVNFKNLNFGGMVGHLKESSILNSILRSPSNIITLPKIELNSMNTDIVKIGGMVGNLDNSSIIFSVSQTAIDLTVSEGYSGSVYVGGIVGYVSQSNSKIINCVTETSLDVQGNATVGMIGGQISNPAPRNYNISYIYYLQDTSNHYDTFGDKGGYALSNAEAYLAIENSKIQNSESVQGAVDYFITKDWNASVGDSWDFVDTFMSYAGNISLQAFDDPYKLSIRNSEPIEIQGFENTQYFYDDTATFTFKFKEEDDQANSKYYRLSTLNIGDEIIANFRFDEETGTYSLSTLAQYDRISMVYDDESKTYTVTISGVTSNYEGVYSIATQKMTFSGKFTYRLYDGNIIQNEVSKTECFVYRTGGDSNRSDVTISNLEVGSRFNITTKPKDTSYYVFSGWYLVGGGEEGQDLLISESQNLVGVFGEGYYVDSFEVYAKYDSNACDLIFEIDSGVHEVILGSSQYTINNPDEATNIKIFKQLTELRMQLYLKEGYSFDVETFMQDLNLYDRFDIEVDFCTLLGEPVVLDNGMTLYEFNLNMANLNPDKTNQFAISFQTVYENGGNNNLVWIIVGSVAGGLLLVGLIILIIVLVRRRGGFGGGKISRSSFKKGGYF